MQTEMTIGVDPHETYRYSLRVMRKIIGRRPVGVQDADDLANETAMRFWSSDNPDKMKNPRAFIYGISRNVFKEALRDERRQQEAFRFAEVPDLAPSPGETISPLKGEFVDRLFAIVSKGEKAILPELMAPEGRTRREMAKELGKTESAFSEAIRRITAKANTLHAQMVTDALVTLRSAPQLDAQSHLLGLARTPEECIDFRIRLIDLLYKSAFGSFSSDVSCVESELTDAERHFKIVRDYRIKYRVLDQLIHSTIQRFYAYGDAFPARQCEDKRFQMFERLHSCCRKYVEVGLEEEGVNVYTDMLGVIEAVGGPGEHLWYVDWTLHRLKDPQAAARMQSFRDRFTNEPRGSWSGW